MHALWTYLRVELGLSLVVQLVLVVIVMLDWCCDLAAVFIDV